MIENSSKRQLREKQLEIEIISETKMRLDSLN